MQIGKRKNDSSSNNNNSNGMIEKIGKLSEIRDKVMKKDALKVLRKGNGINENKIKEKLYELMKYKEVKAKFLVFI